MGLAAALSREEASRVPLAALAAVLSAAFDKAALEIISGKPVEEYKEALRILSMGIPGMSANAKEN